MNQNKLRQRFVHVILVIGLNKQIGWRRENHFEVHLGQWSR